MLLLINYSNNSRDLKKIINQILIKELAKEVKRINYVKSYKLINNKVTKNEEKLLLIETDEENISQLKNIFYKKDKNTTIKILQNDIIN